jgi:hypothetical protein
MTVFIVEVTSIARRHTVVAGSIETKDVDGICHMPGHHAA